MKTTTHSVRETRELAAKAADRAQSGEVYALVGELGTGKTEFVRGFVAAINPRAAVQSPSFSILNIYQAPRFPVYHFDFYRLGSADELLEIGFDDYVRGDGVCLIEWADKFLDHIPPEAMTLVNFTHKGHAERVIEMSFP
jgi:tRNA threonylcarbamoyladenosine biosynthesis protein TsaE